jgi:hypothetical protein
MFGRSALLQVGALAALVCACNTAELYSTGGEGMDCDSKQACPDGFFCVNGQCRAEQPATDAGARDAVPGVDRGGADSARPDASQPDAAAPDTVALDVEEVDALMTDSAMPDSAQPDAGPPPWNYAPSNMSLAGLPETGPDITLDCGVTVLDTSAPPSLSNWCGATPTYNTVAQSSGSGNDVLVLVLQSLTIASGSTLELRGEGRAVVILVLGDALIHGRISADATQGTRGPGGNDSSCSTVGDLTGENGNDDVSSGGAGGGGGGGAGFGSNGGSGGEGHGDTESRPAGGSVGQTRGNTMIVPLRGGCEGGGGGYNTVAGLNGGVGGAGGGAVQLSVKGTLTIEGVVSAGGGGGAGGTRELGAGGGGGSGGAILLEADAVELATSAVVAVNGGGGGQGAGVNNSGEEGQDAKPSGAAAFGGNDANGYMGDGGDGAYLDVSARSGDGASPSGPGGVCGGGGGRGRIRINFQSSCVESASAVLSGEASYSGTCSE